MILKKERERKYKWLSTIIYYFVHGHDAEQNIELKVIAKKTLIKSCRDDPVSKMFVVKSCVPEFKPQDPC